MESFRPERKVKKIIWKFGKEAEPAIDSSEQEDSPAASQENKIKRRRCDSLQLTINEPQTKYSFRPCMIAPIAIPGPEDNSRASLVLTGTACKGGTVPPVGAVDIGVSKSAYCFRIALPGVKRDPASKGQVSRQANHCKNTANQCSFFVLADQFNCEIKHNGQIHIRGVTTTGGETVSRYSRIFKMKIQHQHPPGPFSVSFRLPGPVDPRLCALNFTNDGIFEGFVGKFEQ